MAPDASASRTADTVAFDGRRIGARHAPEAVAVLGIGCVRDEHGVDPAVVLGDDAAGGDDLSHEAVAHGGVLEVRDAGEASSSPQATRHVGRAPPAETSARATRTAPTSSAPGYIITSPPRGRARAQ